MSDFGIVATIGALCFLLGMIAGANLTRESFRSDAIKAGVGRYNPTNGVFEIITNK